MAIAVLLLGCVSVHSEPLPAQRMKAELLGTLIQQPDETVFAKKGTELKYGASELWVFHYPDGSKYHYYFRGEELIAIDYIEHETW